MSRPIPVAAAVPPASLDFTAFAPSSSRRGIERAVEFVARHFGEELTLGLLARAAGMPHNTLTRRFHELFGTSPMRWLWRFRVLLAAEMIDACPEWALTDVAVHCGFGSSAHFSRRFRQELGETPSRHRAGARQRLRALQRDGALKALPRLADDNPVVVARALSRSKRAAPD
jgi:transcriptional regulator GlxA family with amidase domain